MAENTVSILILNHEAETKAFLKTFLHTQGFDVKTTQEESALETEALTCRPDVLIVDQPFYENGELAFLNCLENTPVIFISSIPPESLVHYRKIKQLRNKADFIFLEKPLQEDELLQSIDILTATVPSEKHNNHKE